MPAEVETMFSVREVPWHRLGKVIDTAPNSIEAIRLAGLDWKVESRPIFDAAGNEIPGFVANTRDSDNSVLGIVSKRYKIIQNEEAFAFTDALMGEGMVYETAGSLKSGRTIWLMGKLPEPYKIVGEDVEQYLCFTNNFEGTGAVKVFITPIRVVCQNTLNFALDNAKRTWSCRHIGELSGKLKDARDTLKFTEIYMKALDEETDKLANCKLSDEELLNMFDIMYPTDYSKDSERKITNTKELKNNFIRCLSMPDVAPFRNTAYAGIMAATDLADHCTPLRLTDTYYENNWGKILTGHPFVDKWYDALTAKL